MNTFRDWLQDTLGLGPVIQDVVLFPLLAIALISLLRRGLLAIALHKVTSRKLEARWRVASAYIAFAVGLALTSGIWLASLQQIAELFTATPEKQAQIQTHVKGGVYTLLATFGLVFLLRFVWRLARLGTRFVHRWAERDATAIRFRGLELITRDRVRSVALLLVNLARGILALLLVYIYVPLVLNFFPITAPYGDILLQYIARPATDIAKAVVAYIPNLIYLIVLGIAVRYALKFLRFVLDAIGKGDLVIGNFEPEWADPTYRLLRVIAFAFTLMTAFPYLPGAESEFFQGFTLFIGALFTLGSTAAVGNMVSGVILTYTRAFKIGDRVRIGDSTGDIVAKSLLVTHLRTIQNEEITIPNGVVLSGEVINFSNAAKEGQLVLTAEVGIGYDVHWTEIEQILKSAAARTPAILRDPEPAVWPKALGDFAVTYELRACTDRADRMGATYAALRRNILDAMHDAGVEIMTPSVQALRDASQVTIPTQNSGAAPAAGRGIQLGLPDLLNPFKAGKK